MSSDPNKPQGFGKWLGRIIAVILIGFAAFILLAWYLNTEESQSSAGSTSPNMEQAPVQSKPANPGDKKFNF